MRRPETSSRLLFFHMRPRLDLLQNTLLELPLDLLSLIVRTRLAVQSHQSTKIELGCLEKLDLADVDLFEDYRQFLCDFSGMTVAHREAVDIRTCCRG